MRYEFRAVADCNMCGSGQMRLLGLRLSNSQGWNPRDAEGIAVPVKQCCKCGLIFTDPQPIPDDLGDHYGIPPEEYWGSAQSWTPDYFRRQIETAMQLIGFVPGKTALDIGAGTGLAMKSLAAAGFDVHGIEPSEPFWQRAIANGADPARLTLARIEDAQFAPASFDFITFGAVLEHLFDPGNALDKALSWLRPGGVIQAEVPNADWLIPRFVNRYFRLRGTNYVTHLSPMHPPFHLYEFKLNSFRRYEVVRHWYDVCDVTHVPWLFKPFFRWWMGRTNSGMQLTIYLRKQRNGGPGG